MSGEKVNKAGWLWKTLSLGMVLLSAPAAVAAVTGLPDQIVFKEKPVEVEFAVSNSSQFPQPLEVMIHTVGFEVLSAPKVLQPGETAQIRVALYPRAELVGQTYQSEAVVKVGSTEYRKNVELVFEKTRTLMERKQPTETGNAAPAGFVLLGNNDDMLNIALGLVAALLLISFISRFVKRLATR